MVKPGASVIDVGTDHAMVPVWLIQTGVASRALATDIRSGPLQHAASLIEETGTAEHIRLLQTDGLAGVGRSDGDTVILAGMGGETMVSILSAAPWTKEGISLILEPQSKKADLRRFLIKNGYQITAERLVKDTGRIYPILCAQGGASPAYTEAELHLGLLSQIGHDPLFLEYLDRMRAQAEKAAPYDPASASLVEAYNDIKRRLAPCPQ